ncbi:hypothetical protein S40288_04401 [Stachybotrys chartarum IBT 40288]|nr:hypothetical protein S40288_04401 [Stachybotrys chartarum IBT 40288]
MAHAVDKSSPESTKGSKRKEQPGTRSVLTLSREQLERKRANDREAQRAIRARTKDYIERLESELREFKDTQREKLIEELQARNKALQEEVWRLQRSHGITADSSPYQSAVYDVNLQSSTGSGAMPSPRTSPFPSGPGDYAPLPDYNRGHFVQVTSNPDSWHSAPTSAVSNTVASSVPSPSSSVPADEYYVPSGPVPAAMIPSGSSSSSRSSSNSRLPMGGPRTHLKMDYFGSETGVKTEYDDVDGSRSNGMLPGNQPRSAEASSWAEYKTLMGDAEANFRLSSQPMSGFMPTQYIGQHHQPPPSSSPHHSQPHMDMYPCYISTLNSPLGMDSPLG